MAVSQLDKANRFLSLHREGRPFILANAWDAGSTRVLQGMGFSAIGTSSWASANVYGKRDHGNTREESMAHARAIVEATDLPVSADLESGFGATLAEVAETYRQAAAEGLVGASIEDVRPSVGDGQTNFDMLDISEAAERVAAAVEATRNLGFPFLVTARADGLIRGKASLDDTIRRLQAYESAGADVLMAPGLPDLASVKAVCASINRPFNFTAGIPKKSFSFEELRAVGVGRISLAMSLYGAAMGALFTSAREVAESGTFNFVEELPLSYWDIAGYMRE